MTLPELEKPRLTILEKLIPHLKKAKLEEARKLTGFTRPAAQQSHFGSEPEFFMSQVQRDSPTL